MTIEYEAKFLGIDKEEFRKTLAAANYVCTLPEFLFKRQVFDVPGFSSKEKWGRVRLERDVINLNIKQTTDQFSIDGTSEKQINLPVNDNPAKQFDEAVAFMAACGLIPKGLQENKREIWCKENIEISIDTWPGVMPYVEVEAENEMQVRKACVELNLNFAEAKFGGILAVYEEGLGIAPDDFCNLKKVAFDDPPKKS